MTSRSGARLAISRSSRRQQGGPTISDVARLAGVSPMTVSRVINAEANVRDATRARVQQAVAALDYAPNQAARMLAGAALSRIGLLYANPSAGFVGEFLIGSLDEATRRNVQLVFEKIEPGERDVDVARRLVEDGIDGVVLTPPLCESEPVLAVFRQAAIPTVLLATAEAGPAGRSVAIDDRLAACRMTEHLLAMGHARIGFVAGDPNLSASALRLLGYRDALRDAGRAVDETLIVEGLFTYRSGLAAAERLLDRMDRPTAIFASNDDMAAATIAVAHRHRLDVPRDLSVVGFDDSALATTIWPELTTIRQPIADMSRRAVNRLVDAIRGLDDDRRAAVEVVNFTLVARQSDAPPGGTAMLDRGSNADSATS